MNNSSTTAKTAGNLLEEIHSLVGQAENLVGNGQSEPDAETIGALRARLTAAQDCLSDLYGGARKKVIEGARYTDDAVRANPYQSIAIAAVVGLAIGVLAGRRTSN